MGAIVGGAVGGLAMAAVYVVTLVPAVAEIGLVAFLVGPEGMLATTDWSLVLFWATGPIAAAVTGWAMAPRALAGDTWSGVAMGFATYFAVLIGPFIVLGPFLLMTAPDGAGEAPLLGALAGMSMYVAIGAVLLFPLLGPCVLGGAVWAAVLRRIVAPSGGVGVSLPFRPQPAAWMVATAIVLGVMWLGATVFLVEISQSEVWID